MDVSNLVPALDPYQLARTGVAEMSLALSLRRQRFVTGKRKTQNGGGRVFSHCRVVAAEHADPSK